MLERLGAVAAPQDAWVSKSSRGRSLGVGTRRRVGDTGRRETPWSSTSESSWKTARVLRQRISNNPPLVLLEVQQAESRMVSLSVRLLPQGVEVSGAEGRLLIWCRPSSIGTLRAAADGFGRGLIRRGCHVPFHEMHPCHDWLWTNTRTAPRWAPKSHMSLCFTSCFSVVPAPSTPCETSSIFRLFCPCRSLPGSTTCGL